LKRTAVISVLLLGSWVLLSCGSSKSTQATTSGLTFRVFASQDLNLPPSTTFPAGVSAGMYVIDATKDLRSGSFVNTNNAAGRIVEAANKSISVVIGTDDNTLSIVNNTSETSTGRIVLPNRSESVALAPNGSFAYAAVPNATVLGQAPGAIEVVSVGGSAITNTLSVPGAHYVFSSNSGNRLLVFSDNSDTATIINTGDIGTATSPFSSIAGFDTPVWATFSADDSTAYVLNCGPECGGRAASLQRLDMTTNTLVGTPIPLDAATVGLLSGNTLYVAGTPKTAPANSCAGANTAATICGRLDVVDLSAARVTASYVIVDGYHDRLDISDNGQLFIGARNCTGVNANGEVRGCLAIFNSIARTVIVPPESGDATGVATIRGRNVAYVVQGGLLRIYDTTTDKPSTELNAEQLVLTGQMIDVKLIDF